MLPKTTHVCSLRVVDLVQGENGQWRVWAPTHLESSPQRSCRQWIEIEDTFLDAAVEDPSGNVVMFYDYLPLEARGPDTLFARLFGGEKIGYRINVPMEATGFYHAGIAITRHPDPKGAGVTQTTELIVPILLHVINGPVFFDIELLETDIVTSASSPHVTLELSNKGHSLSQVEASAQLQEKRNGRWQRLGERHNFEKACILPDTRLTLKAPLSMILAPGQYRLVTNAVVGGHQIGEIIREIEWPRPVTASPKTPQAIAPWERITNRPKKPAFTRGLINHQEIAMMGTLDEARVKISPDACTGDPDHTYSGGAYVSLYADNPVQLHVLAIPTSLAGGQWHPWIEPNGVEGNVLAELSILGEHVDLTKLVPGDTKVKAANVTVQMIPELDYDLHMKGLDDKVSACVLALALAGQGLATGANTEGTAKNPGTQTAKGLITLDLGSGVTLELVHVPEGTFYMGSEENEKDRDRSEGPARRVQITESFYLGKYEITQDQYAAVMGNNPSHFSGRNLPVDSVRWNDAVAFCQRLSTKTGRKVRLPTEAEWEYACRAGTDTRFYWGNDADSSQVGDYAWHKTNSSRRTHAVGQKQANSLGIHDMSGNVWEWCTDWYADSYRNAPRVNPKGREPGNYRVLRGGCWDSDAWCCRSANRGWFAPVYHRFDNFGFRVALDF